MATNRPDNCYRTKLEQLIEARRFEPRKWVADALGVDISTVYRWCEGSRTPRPAIRLRLAELLEVDEADLIGKPDGCEEAAG